MTYTKSLKENTFIINRDRKKAAYVFETFKIRRGKLLFLSLIGHRGMGDCLR